MSTQLDPFEARVLAELRRHVSERRDVPTRRRTTAWWVAGLAAAATVAVAGVVLVPGLGSTTAYSVQEGNSGEIEVEINRPEDATGLEQALEGHGIAADITYLPDMQTCAPGRYTEVERSLPGMSTAVGSGGIIVTLPPGTVREGETFVLAWSVEALADHTLPDGTRATHGTHASVEFGVAAGPVAPCEPVPGE